MTGYPNHNLQVFREAATSLIVVGYHAVNPGARGVIEGYDWNDYMRDAIGLLIDCDAVALLPGWERSKGARLEFTIAHDLGIRVESLDTWIREAGK